MTAWFPRACYVELPGGLVTLVAPDVPAGPTYVVLEAAPPPADGGSRVRVAEGRLEIGGEAIAVTTAEPWRGALAAPAEVRRAGDRIARAAKPAGVSALHGEPYRARAARAHEILREGGLEEASNALVGMGPGLTPSGDDALAGVLFGLRAAAGPAVEPLTLSLAEAGETGAISRAFLRWAARGQALAPVHDLLTSAAASDVEGAASAARRVADIGETSGADFLLGLTWGVEAAYRTGDPAPVRTRR